MTDSQVDTKRTVNVVLIAASLSSLEVSLLSVFSLLASLTSLDRNFVVFLVFAVTCGVFGLAALKARSYRNEFTAGEIFQIIALNFAVVILLCSVIYIALGVCSTFDRALLEATSGLSTTSLTNVRPESLGESILLFRSLTQWLGGIGALVMVFVALPAADRTDEFDVSFAKSFTARTVSGTLLRLIKFYSIITLIAGVVFVVAGMTVFDSLCHALTSVSSGGFSTKNASIAGFESGAIEWVVATVMLFTGINMVILWWVWKRKFTKILENSDLRFYLILLTAAIACFSIWRRDIGSFARIVRESFFLSSSLLSTTGFTSVNWEFPSGMTVLVLLLLGVGAMAGSSGGGYGSARVLQHYRFARRELTQQYKPSSVRVVKISGEVIDERALQRLHGFTAIFLSLVAAGAFLIALASPRTGLTQVLSFSLTCLATAGPFLGSTALDSGIEFNAVTHVVASALMVLGRLSIFPIAYLGVAAFRTFREGPLRRIGYRAQRS